MDDSIDRPLFDACLIHGYTTDFRPVDVGHRGHFILYIFRPYPMDPEDIEAAGAERRGEFIGRT